MVVKIYVRYNNIAVTPGFDSNCCRWVCGFCDQCTASDFYYYCIDCKRVRGMDDQPEAGCHRTWNYIRTLRERATSGDWRNNRFYNRPAGLVVGSSCHGHDRRNHWWSVRSNHCEGEYK